MGSLDKASRAYAVPVIGHIWGHDYTDMTEFNLSDGAYDSLSTPIGGSSDDYYLSYVNSSVLPVIYPSPSLYNPLRIILPHVGQVTACKLDFGMAFAGGDNGLQCQVAIGQFVSLAPFYTASGYVYNSSYISQSWTKINGKPDPLVVASGSLSASDLNLMSAFPSAVEDAFVLVFAFNHVPNNIGFQLNYLNIHMTVTGVG